MMEKITLLVTKLVQRGVVAQKYDRIGRMESKLSCIGLDQDMQYMVDTTFVSCWVEKETEAIKVASQYGSRPN